MPPLLVATVPPPPEAGGWDSAARFLLGIAGWPIPRWLRPTVATPSDILSAYADVAFLWPEYEADRPWREAVDRAGALSVAGRVVVLLGRETERAFQMRFIGWGQVDFFEWAEPAAEPNAAQVYALLPYPSSWNRLWNYQHNLRLGRQMLNRTLEMDCLRGSA